MKSNQNIKEFDRTMIICSVIALIVPFMIFALKKDWKLIFDAICDVSIPIFIIAYSWYWFKFKSDKKKLKKDIDRNKELTINKFENNVRNSRNLEELKDENAELENYFDYVEKGLSIFGMSAGILTLLRFMIHLC